GGVVDCRRRKLEAAEALLSSGAIEHGTRLLQALKEELPAGSERAAVLWRLATSTPELERVVALSEQALQEASADDELLCLVHLQLAMAWPLRGIKHALEHGALGLRHA